MKPNISMMRDWLKCPQYAYNLHQMQRGGPVRPVPLDEGTLFHESMVLRLQGLTCVPAHDTLPSWLDVSAAAREAYIKHKLWLPAEGFKVPDDWQVVAIEHALSCNEFQGRLDAIVFWNGKYWSLQWKTYEGDQDALIALNERVRLSWHEVGYQYLAELHQFQPWGGTILGACAKLPGYRRVNGKNVDVTDEQRARALTMHYLFRSPEKQQEMLTDLFENLHLMGQGTSVRRNYDSCFGPFGRGRCQFFPVCHEGAKLSEPPFVDIESRYPDE